MFVRISERITKQLEENNVFSPEDRELYRYGIQQGFVILLNLATTVLIGLFCGMLWQSLLFMGAYIPLRSYAGGYHEKTPMRCYVFSIVLIFTVLLVMKHVSFSSFICGIMLLVSSAVILLLSPVEDCNKPLDAAEQRVYRQRALLIWVSELAITVTCLWLQILSLAICLTATLTVMAVMLLLGQLKNTFYNKYET